MLTLVIFCFGLVVTVVVGFALATLIVQNNRVIEQEDGQPASQKLLRDAVPLP